MSDGGGQSQTVSCHPKSGRQVKQGFFPGQAQAAAKQGSLVKETVAAVITGSCIQFCVKESCQKEKHGSKQREKVK